MSTAHLVLAAKRRTTNFVQNVLSTADCAFQSVSEQRVYGCSSFWFLSTQWDNKMLLSFPLCPVLQKGA